MFFERVGSRSEIGNSNVRGDGYVAVGGSRSYRPNELEPDAPPDRTSYQRTVFVYDIP
jgi:hypothetical protein